MAGGGTRAELEYTECLQDTHNATGGHRVVAGELARMFEAMDELNETVLS